MRRWVNGMERGGVALHLVWRYRRKVTPSPSARGKWVSQHLASLDGFSWPTAAQPQTTASTTIIERRRPLSLYAPRLKCTAASGRPWLSRRRRPWRHYNAIWQCGTACMLAPPPSPCRLPSAPPHRRREQQENALREPFLLFGICRKTKNRQQSSATALRRW